MDEEQQPYRFYSELASWWPLISPPDEYEEEASFVLEVIRTAPIHVHDLLELGSGGGNNAAHLKSCFNITLVDLSPQMLEVSRQLNPECEHVQADMRSVRLDRRFEAVFVHDAIDYMTTEDDLRRVVDTAFTHCRPGGLAVFVPDETRETFQALTGHGGTDDLDGRGVRYLEWTWDPDPDDSWVLTEFAFVFHDAGRTRFAHETHRLGLFSRQTWLGLIAEAGFDAEAVPEKTSEHRAPRELFVGRRPES